MFIFQYLNDKILNYVLFDITVNFVNQKLKKHTHFPHNLYKLSKAKFLVLTEQEETKTRYFAPIWLLSSEGFEVVKEVSKAVKSAQA